MRNPAKLIFKQNKIILVTIFKTKNKYEQKFDLNIIFTGNQNEMWKEMNSVKLRSGTNPQMNSICNTQLWAWRKI